MQITRAEAKARAYAEIARGYGMDAEIVTEHEDPVYYTDGEVMLPGKTWARLTIRESVMGFWGDTLYATWRTYDKTPGRRAGTRFVGARKSAVLIPDRKFASERAFANWLSVYKRMNV